MSNTDPIGNVGVLRQDSDFELALGGGTKFYARLQRLGELRDQHDTSLQRLNLGKAAEEAYAEADKHLTEAKKLREDAATTRAEAKAEQERLLAAARAEADRVGNEARAAAEAVKRTAESVRKDAEEYAHSRRHDADGHFVAAKKRHEDAERAMTEVKALKADAAAAKRKSEEETATATGLQADLAKRLDKLKAVMAELMK
jgi:hypothetical protein